MIFLNYGVMKKILIYGFYLLAAAVLTAGCVKDEAAAPAAVSGERLTLRMPDTQEVAVTRAATEAECRIGSLYALVYRSGALVHKQTVAAAEVTCNGTAQPSVDLDYKLRTATGSMSWRTMRRRSGLRCMSSAREPPKAGLSALLVYANPVYGRVMAAFRDAADVRIGHLVRRVEHLRAGAFAGQSLGRAGRFGPLRQEDPELHPGGSSPKDEYGGHLQHGCRQIRNPECRRARRDVEHGRQCGRHDPPDGRKLLCSLSDFNRCRRRVGRQKYLRQTPLGADSMRRCRGNERILPARLFAAAFLDLRRERTPRTNTSTSNPMRTMSSMSRA